jgi:5-methylcytosine-specific restriction endonuclease McrBC regulatory subunit McrC
MNLLFEEFIVEFMKKNKKSIDLNIYNVDSQVSSKYVFKNNKFNLKPDIIVNYNNDDILVIDTKYKKLSNYKTNY